MILEAVELCIKAGRSKAFVAAFRQALPLVQSIDGFISCELQRCVDRENRYLLLIRWQTLQAHTEGFRLSPQYQQWKSLLHHFYDPFPVVWHYELMDLDSEENDSERKKKSG